MSYSFGKNQRVMRPGDEDQRYRITILLVAEKRPKYWELHCVKCGGKICELAGDVVGLHDVADLNAVPDYHPAPAAIKCGGKFCRLWYEVTYLS